MDPAWMTKADRLALIYHLFEIGELKFHHWKGRNGSAQDPVPFERRIWAVKEGDPGASAFEAAKQKALAARPKHHAREVRRSPTPAETRGPEDGSAEPSAERGRPTAPSMPDVLSPYGSARNITFHRTDLWDEDVAEEYVATAAGLVDPHDKLPLTADANHLDSPCSVPDNAEAKAQWAWSMLDRPGISERMPVANLKSVIVTLAELPVRACSAILGALLTSRILVACAEPLRAGQ